MRFTSPGTRRPQARFGRGAHIIVLLALLVSLLPGATAQAAAQTAAPARAAHAVAPASTALIAPHASPAALSGGTVTVAKAIENGVTSIPAGDWFKYLINYAYASTTENGQNITLVDNLDPDLSWAAGDVELESTVHIASTTYDSNTGKVTFAFVNPLPAGSSGQLGIWVRFPNGSTPNGTVAINTATMDGDNTDPATSNPVSINATAACRWLANVTGPSTATIGANTTYKARLDRPSPAEGNLNVTSGTLALTLPVGVLPTDVVNAGGGAVTGTGVTGDPVIVTWPTGAASADGAPGKAVEKTLIIKFNAARFSNNQTVTLSEQMNVTVLGGGTCSGTDTQSTTLTTLTPSPNGTAAKANSNATPTIGESFYFTLDADSTGNVGLENFTVADALPQNFALASVRLPSVTSGPGGNFIHLIYRRSDTGATEYTWPGSPFAASTTTLPVSALSLPSGVYVSYVRFEMGSVASGFKISTAIRLNGTLLTPGWGVPPQTIAAGAQVCNTMTFTADYNSAPAVNKTSENCVAVYTPQVRPVAYKYRLSTIPDYVAPTAEVTWYAAVGNDTPSDFTMVNPLGMDLLPAALDYVPGSFAEVTAANFDPAQPLYNNAGAPAPTLLDVTPNYNGTGRTRIRWAYTHTFPIGTGATILFKTTFKAGTPPGDYTNESFVSVNEAAQVGPVSYQNSVTDTKDLDGDGSTTDKISRDSAEVGIGAVKPEAWKYKLSTTPSSVTPGQTIRWYAEVGNASGATFNLVNGMGLDLLPPELEYVDGSFAEVTAANYDPANATYNNAGAPAPTLLGVFANYNGTGRQLIRWQYTHNFAPGTWATVTFLTRVKPGAAAGDYTNYSNVSVNEATQPGPVDYQRPTTDTADLDGDGSTTDTLSEYEAWFKIGSAASLDSVKWVKGELDADWTKYPASGFTSPGGAADYRLVVFNSGNAPLRDISITDILPITGDTGVVTPDPRNTQWTPFLAGPVTAPAGVTVYYSTESNPQRNDMGDPDPYPTGSNPPNWSATPPTDITTVRSLRFAFGDIILQGGDQLELTWAMRAPLNAPTAGEIAWNSFGVVATRDDNNLDLLPTEPIKVGIKAQPTVPALYGDRVWNDVNKNGIQDAGELGLDGVRVELYRDNGDNVANPVTDTLASFTLTSGDGKYLFSNLPAGNYYAVFFKPPVYSISPANQGANDSADSDGSPATVRGLPATITAITALGATETDITWDQGFYLPATPVAAVGNYVWHDEDNDGVQNESAANGLNGGTVRLYTSGGSLVATQTTANDVNGNPGYYLFDSLTVASYYLEFVLPSGATFTLQDQGGNDAADSDVNPANGQTATFTLAANQYDPTRDAGILLPTGALSLGNQVWLDANNNGIYDPGIGEIGVDGVRLNLYRDSDNNGVFTPGTDQFFATTSSVTKLGVAGRYLFDNLPAGKFIVQVDPVNFASGGVLEGYRSASGNGVAPDPDDDVNNDDNGEPMTGQGVVSQAITLSAGGEPVNDGDSDNNSNLALDFGFIGYDFGDLVDTGAGTGAGNYETLLANNGPRHIIANPAQRLGATIDAETNAGQAGFAAGDGADEDGVTIPALTPGQSATFVVNAGAAGRLNAWIDWNNDGDFADTGETVATDVALAAGNNSLTVNVPAGATAGADLGARFRFTTGAGQATTPYGEAPNGEVEDYQIEIQAVGSIGDWVWWDVNGDGVQDPSEPGIPNVVVVLTPTVGSPVSVTTNASGYYSFTNLLAGNYTVGIPRNVGDNVGFFAAGWYPTNPATGVTTTVLGYGQALTTVDFGLNIPTAYTLTKTLNSPALVRTGSAISYTIRITNTGNTWLTVLPLRDVYSPTYLTYGYNGSFAAPASNDNTDDGQINWADLTLALGDVRPGASVSVVVTFTARADTTHLPGGKTDNVAEIHDAVAQYVRDEAGGASGADPAIPLPDTQDDAPAAIILPTGLSVTGLQAHVRGRAVTIVWQTANEAQIVGFRLLRQLADGASQPVGDALIPAQHAGANQGAAYAIADAPAPGAYTYVLEVIQADGQHVRAATTTAQVAPPATMRIFLPLVAQAAP